MDKPITPATQKELVAITEKVASMSELLFLQCAEMRRTKTKKGIQIDKEILNVFEFVSLMQFEVSTLMVSMVRSKTQLGPNMYGRFLVLTLYESLLALRKMLGPEFQAELSKSKNKDELNTLKQFHSQINKLADKCIKRFKDVRNGIVGHRDQNPETRILLLESSDVKDVTDMTIEVLGQVQEILPHLSSYFELELEK